MEKLERYLKISYSIATALILTGVALLVLSENYHQGGISLINIGAVIIFVTFLRAKRYRSGPLKDERTVRIGSYGLSYSWFVSFLVLNILFWIDNMALIKLTVAQVLAIMFFVMIVTAKGFQWYLFRKGDVE
ncbi:hypothetical protein V7O66_09770 [Methanolobus sp. ZRKC3]|uniref:hypothetical protein n=1 Tax=Methanolobus sp. ZRKC3 TaxID=3125786 RepID=UPI0032451CBE